MRRMKKLLIVIPLCLLACVGNVKLNKPKSNISGNKNESKIDSTHIWNRIAESIYNISVPDFVHEPFAIKLLQESKALNQEQKVRETFSPMCYPGDTLFFICHITLITGYNSFAFWKKVDDKETNFTDIYKYVYPSHPKEIAPGKYKSCDSVIIHSSSDFVSYSKEFLNACNRWDTTTLKTNKELDGDDYDDEFRLVYRVIIKKGSRFSIQYVKAIHQGNAENLGTPSTIVIYE